MSAMNPIQLSCSEGSMVLEEVKEIITLPKFDAEVARMEVSLETINLGAVALRAGKPVEYDSENRRITNDKDANKFLTREYRKGWEL